MRGRYGFGETRPHPVPPQQRVRPLAALHGYTFFRVVSQPLSETINLAGKDIFVTRVGRGTRSTSWCGS